MGYHENARRLCDFRGLVKGCRDSIDSSESESSESEPPKKKAKESLGFFFLGGGGFGGWESRAAQSP